MHQYDGSTSPNDEKSEQKNTLAELHVAVCECCLDNGIRYDKSARCVISLWRCDPFITKFCKSHLSPKCDRTKKLNMRVLLNVRTVRVREKPLGIVTGASRTLTTLVSTDLAVDQLIHR